MVHEEAQYDAGKEVVRENASKQPNGVGLHARTTTRHHIQHTANVATHDSHHDRASQKYKRALRDLGRQTELFRVSARAMTTILLVVPDDGVILDNSNTWRSFISCRSRYVREQVSNKWGASIREGQKKIRESQRK